MAGAAKYDALGVAPTPSILDRRASGAGRAQGRLGYIGASLQRPPYVYARVRWAARTRGTAVALTPADAHPHELALYRQRVAAEAPDERRRHPDAARMTWLAAYAHLRGRELTDGLVDCSSRPCTPSVLAGQRAPYATWASLS